MSILEGRKLLPGGGLQMSKKVDRQMMSDYWVGRLRLLVLEWCMIMVGGKWDFLGLEATARGGLQIKRIFR